MTSILVSDMGLPGSPDPKTVQALIGEIRRGRAKFPGGRFMLSALMEEVGELAEAIATGDREAVTREAIQIAAVAVRISEQGDETTYRIDGLIQLIWATGKAARFFLQRNPSALDTVLASAYSAVWRLRTKGDPTFADVTDEEAKP